MNILPFLFTFLVFLAISVSFLFQSTLSSRIEAEGTKGYYNSLREMESSGEIRNYKAAIRKESHRSPEKKVLSENKIKKERKEYENKREKQHLIDIELSKLNIASLFNSENKDVERVEKGLQMLIVNLYSHAHFYTSYPGKNLAEDVTKRLRDNWKKSKLDTPPTWTDLIQYEDVVDDIIRKIVVGTRNYNLQEKRGFPPIEHYVRIDGVEYQKSLYFAYTSKPVLDAFFGTKLSNAICEKERAKWKENPRTRLLKKEELEQVMINHLTSPQVELGSLRAHVSFAKKKSVRKQITGFDKQSGIYTTGVIRQEH